MSGSNKRKRTSFVSLASLGLVSRDYKQLGLLLASGIQDFQTQRCPCILTVRRRPAKAEYLRGANNSRAPLLSRWLLGLVGRLHIHPETACSNNAVPEVLLLRDGKLVKRGRLRGVMVCLRVKRCQHGRRPLDLWLELRHGLLEVSRESNVGEIGFNLSKRRAHSLELAERALHPIDERLDALRLRFRVRERGLWLYVDLQQRELHSTRSLRIRRRRRVVEAHAVDDLDILLLAILRHLRVPLVNVVVDLRELLLVVPLVAALAGVVATSEVGPVLQQVLVDPHLGFVRADVILEPVEALPPRDDRLFSFGALLLGVDRLVLRLLLARGDDEPVEQESSANVTSRICNIEIECESARSVLQPGTHVAHGGLQLFLWVLGSLYHSLGSCESLWGRGNGRKSDDGLDHCCAGSSCGASRVKRGRWLENRLWPETQTSHHSDWHGATRHTGSQQVTTPRLFFYLLFDL